MVGLINYPTVDNPLPAQPTERSRKATEENTHGDAQPTKTMKLHDQMKSKYFNAQASNDATLQQTDDIFDDDIVNSLDDVIDNGYVFTFAQSVANILRADPNNGDLYMPRAAYKPMLNSILNEFPGGITTYDELYQNLCSVGEITNNCSVLSILFEGDTDRTISDYNYQPSTDGAYQNTLYNETSFHNIIINPPVTLVYVSTTYMTFCN